MLRMVWFVSPTSEGQPGEKNVPPVMGLPCHAATQCGPEPLGCCAKLGTAASTTRAAAAIKARTILFFRSNEFTSRYSDCFICRPLPGVCDDGGASGITLLPALKTTER